ncbi:MAG: DUF2493 domain-containing protein [Oscillospiraceae bacterium]|nr:DUF2493 domain-containing protein [Oscillospiraceae bacterium]
MRVAVVGSRSLDGRCYGILTEHMPSGASEIISGGAVGVDRLAERYALERGLPLTVIRPDYKTYDRQAPLIRNTQIVAESDFTLVLWDGFSRGSLNVIMTCIRTNKPFKVLLVK